MPRLCTSISTSAAPGTGSGTSRTSTPSGPVVLTTWAARMAAIVGPQGGGASARTAGPAQRGVTIRFISKCMGSV